MMNYSWTRLWGAEHNRQPFELGPPRREPSERRGREDDVEGVPLGPRGPHREAVVEVAEVARAHDQAPPRRQQVGQKPRDVRCRQ